MRLTGYLCAVSCFRNARFSTTIAYCYQQSKYMDIYFGYFLPLDSLLLLFRMATVRHIIEFAWGSLAQNYADCMLWPVHCLEISL